MPYLTADLPGVGGAIKRRDEDFLVEEVPLYDALGEGTHVYFMIEKRGLTTLAAIRQLARALGRASHEIGYAGLKDAHGVTRQWLSIEHVDPARVEALGTGRIKVLRITRHRNKIKLGHLAGNRFGIKIRGMSSDAKPAAESVLAVLAGRGVPNTFGPQRFGVRGDNAMIGRAMVVGDYHEALSLILGRPGPADHGPARRARQLFDDGDYRGAAEAWPRGAFPQQARLCRVLSAAQPSDPGQGRKPQAPEGAARKAFGLVDRTLKRLYVSAFQSELFNRVVARRIEGIHRVMTGDLAWKHANGACFRVEDAEAEQARCDAFEISVTGPLFGKRMTEAAGEPGRIEAEVLAETGLTLADFAVRQIGKLDGARRPLRVPLSELGVREGVDDFGAFLSISYFLPAGAYATNVIREVCKAGKDGDVGGRAADGV